MNNNDILKIFKDCNALLEGHFLLSSGLHSDRYLQASLVLQYPEKAELLSKELAEKFRDKKIDVVIGPALGGIVISYQLAKSLGCRALFAERVDNVMAIRRGFKINKDENVLVVEDVITTGASAKEVIELVKHEGGNLIGVATLIDRSGGNNKLGSIDLASLVKLDVKTYSANDCPLCQDGQPIIKPGSKKIK